MKRLTIATIAMAGVCVLIACLIVGFCYHRESNSAASNDEHASVTAISETAPKAEIDGARASAQLKKKLASIAVHAARALPNIPEDVQQVLSDCNFEPETWRTLAELSSQQLDEQLEETRISFEQKRKHTLALQKQHADLALEQQDDAAHDLMNEQILPLLEERQRLVGRTLLIAHARRQLLVDSNIP